MRRFVQKLQEAAKDNRGLTLVELLIAVVIMGIVTTPLLHGFLTSANTEVKARKMGEATFIAQNVMECVKANEVEVLLPEDAAAGLATAFSASGAKYYTLTDGTYTNIGNMRPEAPVTEGGEEAGGEAMVTELKEYHVGFSGFSAGGRNYYAMVDYNAAVGDAAEGGSNTNSIQLVDLNGINETLMSGYSPMDIVCQVPENALEANRTISLVIGRSETELTAMLTYITVQESNVNSGGATVDDAETGENAGGESGEGTGGATGGDTAVTKKTVSYTSEYSVPVTEDKVPAVYLFYYPNYNGKDGINVEVNNLGPVDVFIVKRVASSYESLSDLSTMELNYKCAVTLSATDPSSVTVHSNINENLSYTVGGSAYGSSMMDGFISWNLGSLSFSDILVSSEQTNRIYEVTVKIYDNADFQGEALCTLYGTKLK